MPRKKPCKCPPKKPRRKPFKVLEPTDVSEIIQALTYEDVVSRLGKRTRIPKFRTKPFKPPHFKDTCVPMTPSMHTRLRYIGHCSWAAPRRYDDRKAFEGYDFFSPSEEEFPFNKKFKKRVRYYDLLPGDVMLPTPKPVIQHTASDKSILNVGSPRTSGEVIQARRASVKPGELVPPLPPKSGYELFKPHSGLVLNQDKDYAPDVNYGAGPPIEKRKEKHKHGICYSNKCSRKRCRKYAALRQKRFERKRRSGSDVTSRGGATDGKPRARSSKRYVADDDSTCGLDDIPRPEHIQIPKNLKRGALQTHSLTVIPCTKDKKPAIHYGILTGTFNMYNEKFSPRSRGRQAMTMSVMAYCLAFHYHPKQWTMKLIDHLVDAADQWYLQCADKVHDHSAVQGMCEVLPFGKKQVLLLNGKKMQVLLGEPDIVGYTMSLDPTVYNLCRGLKAFFKDNRAGLMMSRVLKVVIWRDKVCYYIFDAAGRDSRAYSNYTSGAAALINVKNLESVAEVLLARSILEDQKFVLAPVKVLKMVDEKDDEDLESDRELTQAEKAMLGYRILNENCAIVNANMHLGDRCFEEAKFRQAIPIAVVAMTYAKISPPNTWFTKTLDKILRLGNKLYLDCLHPKMLADMTIDNIPNEIIVGPYVSEIIIYRDRVKGQLFTTKECLFNIRTGLEEFFSHEYNSGILDFNNYALAVWRQKDMFYLFDPYPRTNDGNRTMKSGRACCWMLLNPDAMADVFTMNWNSLPMTTQFYIHAFKVLKLKKKEPKTQLRCTLSDDELHGPKRKVKRQVLHMSQAQGDGREFFHDILPDDSLSLKPSGPQVDEEQMGDIVSLVDSIQEGYVPHVPMKYKNMPEEDVEPKVINLDSPTVSVTQVIPPWPKPRDKTNEPPEPDPDPEPTPPPTPPPAPPPEGGDEEEEAEEEEDEETMKRKKEEEELRKAEEEEARRKAEELPPALPPPPPTPQSELELPLAPVQVAEDEVQTLPAGNVDRKILLTEDARYRSKLRRLRRKMTSPLGEFQVEVSPSEELAKPSNFKDLPDHTQIVRGSTAISDKNANDILPFAAIMAIVMSYKYSIDTWTTGIVNFIVESANKLYSNKRERFQMAPMHIIPKIGIGHQAYHATIDVAGEGATWQLEDVLKNKFFTKYDRGMLTTPTYSCAIFQRNGLYYLYDASNCNAMGLRGGKNKGKACFLRFHNVHDLVTRILYNKDGQTEDQQFILSRILVRRLLTEPRLGLPEDYDYETGASRSYKSKPTIISSSGKSGSLDKRTSIDLNEPKSQITIGYQQIDGVYRIEGTTALKGKGGTDIKACHFVCLIAMLMAAMHPIRTWDHFMVDICIEKGLEIYYKAANLNVCEKRVIKNVIIDGKFININIKKIIVVNENPDKLLSQYLRAVLKRLRYVIIRYPQCSMVICQTDGYYHLFDPYPPPSEEPEPSSQVSVSGKGSGSGSDSKEHPINKDTPISTKRAAPVATWNLYRSLDALMRRIKKAVPSADNPEFYTFELTSVKNAPRHSALNYRLSPLFKPDENPNQPYLKRRKIRSLVDEKMYWLNIATIPWSRMNPVNDLGFERDTPKALWKNWDIEFPGDLYSLWGTLHPLDSRFEEKHRGKQYLATCVVAIAMTQTCSLSAWSPSFLDGIVTSGHKYHVQSMEKIGDQPNHEIELNDLVSPFNDMFPFSFTVKFDNVIFGFVYNIYPDRFNLSKALLYFFEKNNLGILVSPTKNLAFGRLGSSYFMFDCQSYSAPLFNPSQGAAYILKCESLNRLIYCITLTLNLRRHGQQFNLFSVSILVSEVNK